MGFSLSEKAQKVLTFLLGLRYPEIAKHLSAYGFTQADREEGFRLLSGVTEVKLEPLPKAPPNPNLLLQLDGWENHWFPIASASLKRHYPSVHEVVFANLNQAEGAAVIVTVGTFVDRVSALSSSGEEGEALALLEKRGLNEEVMEEARKMLSQLADAEPEPEGDLESRRAALAEAEALLWEYYLEWSAIARAAIKDKRLLRKLGFGKPRKKPAPEPDVE